MQLKDIYRKATGDSLKAWCDEAVYDGSWPRTIVDGDKVYVFIEKEPHSVGNLRRFAKYSIAAIISLSDQAEMLKPIPADDHDGLLKLPYGLQYPPNQLAQISKSRVVGHLHSPKSYSDIVVYATDLASTLNCAPTDLSINVAYHQIQFLIVERESDEAYAARINAIRHGIIEKYFTSMRSMQLAEQDPLASEKRAYQQLLKLQEKFATFTPEQIKELVVTDE